MITDPLPHPNIVTKVYSSVVPLSPLPVPDRWVTHLCIAAPYVTEAVAQWLQELHHAAVVALVVLHQRLAHGQPHAPCQLVLMVLLWVSGYAVGHHRQVTGGRD